MQEGQCHDSKRTCYPGLQLLDFQSKSGTSLFILHCSIDNDLREETKEGLETYKVSRRLGDVLACIFFSKSFNLSKCGLTKVGRNPGHLDPSGLDSIFCAPSVTSWQQHNCRDTMGTDAHEWNPIHNRTTLGISTQSIRAPLRLEFQVETGIDVLVQHFLWHGRSPASARGMDCSTHWRGFRVRNVKKNARKSSSFGAENQMYEAFWPANKFQSIFSQSSSHKKTINLDELKALKIPSQVSPRVCLTWQEWSCGFSKRFNPLSITGMKENKSHSNRLQPMVIPAAPSNMPDAELCVTLGTLWSATISWRIDKIQQNYATAMNRMRKSSQISFGKSIESPAYKRLRQHNRRLEEPPNDLLKLGLKVSLASAISAPVVVQGACFDACKCMSLPVRMKPQM